MDFFEFATSAMSILQQYNSGESYRLLVLSLIIGASCYLLVYVFQAIALYAIASREGFKNRWMAFIPLLNTYYIGVVADKNKIFNFKAKTVSAILAAVETIIVVFSVLYFVSAHIMFSGGYASPEYEPYGPVMGEMVSRFVGYRLENVPVSLNWAAWFFSYTQYYILSWLEIIYILFNVFLLSAFFQTYATRRYFLFTIFSVLFPVKGILFFAVRNNKGRNYREFIREMQQRQYRMYQEMNRQNMGGNPYNYNPYTGTTNPPQSDPYRDNRPHGAPEDPFSEFGNGGANGGKPSGDPFDDLKN